MRCDICKGEVRVESGQIYHYTECGLDNIYLENIEVRICDSCGAKAPRIPRINELHTVIGKAIALQEVPLSGPEMRYLRQHLGLKQKDWAMYLKVTPETISRWEAGKQEVGIQTETLIRLFYFYYLNEEKGIPVTERVIDRIMSVVEKRTETPGVLVNMRKTPKYQYRPLSELSEAA